MFSFIKKNLNASRPSEHPPVRGKMSERLGGIIGCKYKTSLWRSSMLVTMIVTLGQRYNIGEKPTAMMCAYINRHGGKPDKTKQKPF